MKLVIKLGLLPPPCARTIEGGLIRQREADDHNIDDIVRRQSRGIRLYPARRVKNLQVADAASKVAATFEELNGWRWHVGLIEDSRGKHRLYKRTLANEWVA